MSAPGGEPGQQPAVTRVVVTSAADMRMERTTWLWDQKLPQGELSIAAGREGAAKSQFGCWLAAQATQGRLQGELYGQPAPVIICAREDSWEKTVKPRLTVAGANLELVHRMQVQMIGSGTLVEVSLPLDTDDLVATVRGLGAALVIFDPLLSVLSPSLNTHRAGDVRMAIEPLAGIAHDTGCSFLGLAHFAKTEGRDAAEMISGSHAFKDVARSVLVFARDEAESGVMSHVKSNLGPLPPMSLAYSVERMRLTIGVHEVEVPRWMPGELTARHVEDLLDTGQARSRAEARNYLRAALGNGARPSTEIADEAKNALDIAPRTLARAKKELNVVSYKNKDGRWWMELPRDTYTHIGGSVGIDGNHGSIGNHGTVPGQADSGTVGTVGKDATMPNATPPRARAHAREAGWWLLDELEQPYGVPRINWQALWDWTQRGNPG